MTFKIIQIEKGKWYTSACIGIVYLSVFALSKCEQEKRALALKSALGWKDRHTVTRSEVYPWASRSASLGLSFFYCCCLVAKLCPTLVTPWTVALQSLSMGFPRQEYWSGLPFHSPGDLPNPGIEPVSPALAGRFFPTEPPGKPLFSHYMVGGEGDNNSDCTGLLWALAKWPIQCLAYRYSVLGGTICWPFSQRRPFILFRDNLNREWGCPTSNTGQ